MPHFDADTYQVSPETLHMRSLLTQKVLKIRKYCCAFGQVGSVKTGRRAAQTEDKLPFTEASGPL
jgi:hypothetical protein